MGKTTRLVNNAETVATRRKKVDIFDKRMSAPARIHGRSVNDFADVQSLREALNQVDTADPSHQKADWLLPVADEQAHQQTVDDEVKRLLTLRSYLALDADREDEFDRLTAEACLDFKVPLAKICLVDLGRQFFFSTTNWGERETPREVSLSSHAIVNKCGILVVPDTKLDPRFKNNELVTGSSHLRFYAGAPLLSPEGMKIGVFSVESPDPRPSPDTADLLKLQRYAQRAMDMLVQRRERIRTRVGIPLANESLCKHAAVTTNLGGLLFSTGEFVVAMKLYQESVQTAMTVEQRGQGGGPSDERREEMAHILSILSLEAHTEDSRAVLFQKVARMFPPSPSDSPSSNMRISCNVNGLPGLFGPTSKIHRPADQCHFAPLVFSESFKIGIEVDVPKTLQFMIPLAQSSKATLFNMGLIHYHWGNPDTAFQFFDLATSFSRELHPLAFDPVILASLNNMAQIHLQYGRPEQAQELLEDALTRGNAALSAMYAEYDSGASDARRSRRLRRKLARTVLNMGHVHYYQCDFEEAESTCVDALNLLHSNMDDMEVAAIRFNTALLRHHQGDRKGALLLLDMFLEQISNDAGRMELQLAEGLQLKSRIMVEAGNLYECMKPLNEALRIRQCSPEKRVVKAAHAETLTLLGEILLGREEFDFALSALKKSLAIHRSFNSGDSLSFDGAQTLMEIGRGLHLKGQLEESLEAYNEVVLATRKFFGDRHVFVARLDSIIGNLLLEADRVEEACSAFGNAMRIHIENEVSPDMNPVKDPLYRHTFSFPTSAGTA